jgi:hypothetical protein
VDLQRCDPIVNAESESPAGALELMNPRLGGRHPPYDSQQALQPPEVFREPRQEALNDAPALLVQVPLNFTGRLAPHVIGV